VVGAVGVVVGVDIFDLPFGCGSGLSLFR